jgi:Zn-dependent peptidase ImmA (M78 family)
MIEVQIAESERRDIVNQVARILRDLGNPDPPLKLSDVRSLLSLDLKYYAHSDPSIAVELAHRFKLFAQKTIPDVGKHLFDALAKSRLCAFWVPENSRILIDTDVPQPKHRWIEAHEIVHSVVPWHKGFLLGDNLQTIDPVCHATIEAEANFGAAQLLFMGDRFEADARSREFSFGSIKTLAKDYGNSIVSTLWRAVDKSDPVTPTFGMISVHPRHPKVGKHDGPNPWRYFIRSPAFQTQFSSVHPTDVFRMLTRHASFAKAGPVVSTSEVLKDVAGELWEFQIESFSTQYALLTFGRALKKRPSVLAASVA